MSYFGRRLEPVSSKVSFPQLEERVLRRWKEEGTFHRVDEVRRAGPLFVFYEGPPTANGSPGIHHVLSRAFKDAVLRYKTMKGYRTLRRGGWDSHGLPVELEVEKELGLNSKQEIEQFGIEEFNRRCRESVFRYVKEWEAMTERAGVWLDMDDAYITYENSYIETCWWVFKQLWDRGLVYEAYKVTPHCPRCVTSLSSHEVALGYQENTPDPSVYVRFRLKEEQAHGNSASGAVLERLGYDQHRETWAQEWPSVLAWTTTPWTLTANVALAVAPDEEYVLVQAPEGQVQERLLLARILLERAAGEGWRVLETFTGQELVGLQYEPAFPSEELRDHTHAVVAAGFVTMDEGTGVVHTAPAYGAEDQELGRALGLPTVHTVDLHGVLQAGFPGAGKFVKQADEELMRDLAGRGLLFRREVYRHTYPFCWRCNTPLLYYAKVSWYIETTRVKDQMVEGNQGIHWYPEHIKEGRFGEWLRNNVDWAISRERYWGTPLPIWRCESCGHTDCIGNLAELGERATEDTKPLVEGLDLHRPYVDRVQLRCSSCGGVMHRVPEVADAWYDSGAMPFAQWKYPREVLGIELEDASALVRSELYPAEYIVEAVDQTRGWFYSLLALSTLITGQPSYRNVISLGLILDEKGEKMSKSKGNMVNPWTVLQDQGADALRWYLFTASPAGNSRRFSSSLVQDTLRRFLLTLWNTYSFFVTYANIDGFDPQAHASLWTEEVGGPSMASKSSNELDRWAISELNSLVETVTREMDGYSPTDAGRRIEEFVESLSNWYVRRSRRRFWKGEDDEEKLWAHVTLYTCLVTLSKLIAPLAPFVADEMYRNLAPEGSSSSVHLADFPVADASMVDETLERAVQLAMRVASLGRAARSKAKVKVRQPLAALRVVVKSPAERHDLQAALAQVQDELNVKNVFVYIEGQVEAVLNFWGWRVTPNMSTIGPRYGRRAQEIAALLASVPPDAVVRDLIVAPSQPPRVVLAGGIELAPEDVRMERIAREGYSLVEESGYAVAVDTQLTPELEEEGVARELVHRIQNVRRNAGLEIADRITTYLSGAGEQMRAVIARHEAYIRGETLSVELVLEQSPQGVYAEEQEVEGNSLRIGVQREEVR